MNAPHIVTAATPTAAPPRPAAAPPRTSSPARPGLKPADEGNGLRVLTYLRLHWLMILFCGTLIGSAGAFAAWELLPSKYESYAMLQVSSVPATVASGGNREQARTDFVTYLKTTSALLKSEYVLNAALRDIKDLPTIKAQKDPLKYLDEELMVNWQDGSEVVRVTFKSHEPADAKKIVDAVLVAFTKEVLQKDVWEKRDFLKAVEDAQIKIRAILDRRATEKTPPAKVTVGAGPEAGPPKDPPAAAQLAPGVPPAAAPVLLAGSDLLHKYNPRALLDKVGTLQQEVERLPITINDGMRQLTLLKDKLDAIKNAPTSQLTVDAMERDPDVVVQILKVKQAKREYDFQYEAAANKSAPGLLRLKAAHDAHDARLTELRKEKAESAESARKIGAANGIAAQMERVIGNLQRLQEQYDTAKTLLAKAEKQLIELPLPGEKGSVALDPKGDPIGYQPETSVTDTTDLVYRRLVQQYYLTQMDLSSPPRVKVIQNASTPTQKDVKKQIIGTVFAGLMGFAVMALGVVAFETMSRRVSSLADVKTATQVPVVGVIPCQPGEAMGKDPLKRAAATEAIDKLRAYVAQSWLARGATTVAVTSPLGDEGKAFAAFGLASSLAQSGYKTLLVDFDLRDPQVHALAGVANEAGVCELLRAEIDTRAAVQFMPSGLHLVPAGKWSDEARKAATGEKLESLLARLKGSYDCVVVHGHALLTAAESVEVARRCEVVLVCARYRETTTPLLKRAAERVAVMEIPYSGIVYVGASANEALC